MKAGVPTAHPQADGLAPPGNGVPGPNTHHPKYKVPGGWLVCRPGWLDAHCDNPEHYNEANPCRINKSVSPANPNSDAGRPAALLMAWLAHSAHFTDRVQHGKAIFKSNRDAKGKEALGDTIRDSWRQWLIGEPSVAKVLEHERDKRAKELDEPRNL